MKYKCTKCGFEMETEGTEGSTILHFYAPCPECKKKGVYSKYSNMKPIEKEGK